MFLICSWITCKSRLSRVIRHVCAFYFLDLILFRSIKATAAVVFPEWFRLNGTQRDPRALLVHIMKQALKNDSLLSPEANRWRKAAAHVWLISRDEDRSEARCSSDGLLSLGHDSHPRPPLPVPLNGSGRAVWGKKFHQLTHWPADGGRKSCWLGSRRF